MDAIPENVMVMWGGSSGSIPTGWTRVSSYDGRILRGASNGAAGGSNGGGSTHGHSGNSHTHSGTSSHTPTIYPGQSGSPASNGSANWAVQNYSNDSNLANARFISNYNHYHYIHYPGQNNIGANGYLNAGAGASSFSSSSVGYPSGTNIPSYHTMCIVKSNGEGEGFADDLIVFYNASSDPSDWTNHAGSRGRFVQGANGGGSNGGGASHSHSGNSHGHTASSNHNHTGETGSAQQPSKAVSWASGNLQVVVELDDRQERHTHALVGSTSSWTITSGGGGGSGGHNYLPPYRRLNTIQNTSGEDNWLEDAICMWEGSYGSIPDGWTVCDGSNSTPDMRDKFVHCADSGGSGSGGTGGTDGHSHNNPGNHTHATNHNHNLTFNGLGAQHGTAGTAYAHPSKDYAHTNHAHNNITLITNAEAVNTGTSSSVTIASVGDNKPTYRTVVFIMAPAEPASGGSIMFGSNF